MERTSQLLTLIYPLVGSVDPELERYMMRAQVGTMFALSWLITWYGHVLKDFRSIVRLYDLFLASHPLMPIYVAAAIVLYRSNEIFSCDCDMAMIHSLLSDLPDNLPLEPLITHATDLFLRYPPSALLKELGKQEKQHGKFKRWPFGSSGSGVGGRSKDKRWGTTVAVRRKLFSFSFFTVTVTAAAWYVYNHYSQLLNWD